MATVELVFAVIGVWVVLAIVAATLFGLVARAWSGRARPRRTPPVYDELERLITENEQQAA